MNLGIGLAAYGAVKGIGPMLKGGGGGIMRGLGNMVGLGKPAATGGFSSMGGTMGKMAAKTAAASGAGGGRSLLSMGAGLKGLATGALAANTALSAVTNTIALISDPEAYVAGLEAKVQAEFEAVKSGQMGMAMLSGAIEGLSDPIGKIAQAIVTFKGLVDDVADALARQEKLRRIEEAGKERRISERGGE